MSVLLQDQIDHASPFAPPRWMDVPSAEAPAYAVMTVVVQSTHQGRGDGASTHPPRAYAALLSVVRALLARARFVGPG